MKMESLKTSINLELHGVAASSSPHTMVFLRDSTLVFSSHCVLNLAKSISPPMIDGILYNVRKTLCTRSVPRENDTNRVITSLCQIRPKNEDLKNDENALSLIACAFSDGTVTLWSCFHDQQSASSASWREHVVVGSTPQCNAPTQSDSNSDSNFFHATGFPTVSIADMDGTFDRVTENGQNHRYKIVLLTASSFGAHIIFAELSFPVNNGDSSESTAVSQMVDSTVRSIHSNTVAAVKLQPVNENELLMVVGTANPKSNKIHVFTCSWEKQPEVKHHGFLTGHLDWITSLEFLYGNCLNNGEGSFLLASGSQDARIRLWKFHKPSTVEDYEKDQNEEYDDDFKDDGDDEFLEEGEARMHVQVQSNGVRMEMAITLEALLIGHEEAVTGISWRPNQLQGKPCLISSSMDRAILIWMADLDGVWIPISRVGSAGGILGGSVGSSLLGFVDTTFSPDGRCIVGHGYGGSLHFWTCGASVDDRNDHAIWKANPCITGHFAGVSDIDWEASTGEYLLSVGLDQTCRMWSHVPSIDCWMEVGRPQVHGYDLTTISCVGTGTAAAAPLHRFVSGADEKELRAFDAPISTIQLLQKLHPNNNNNKQDLLKRVDRAYIPSLGLSNRATAADAMEEGRDANLLATTDDASIYEDGSAIDITQSLPNERDLGVASLWPEVRKLFGHQTELVCLASNAHYVRTAPENENRNLIVASSCKARDIENASIRLWDVESSTCVQVLKVRTKIFIIFCLCKIYIIPIKILIYFSNQMNT